MNRLDANIVNGFIGLLKSDNNSRYKSYEHCRGCFISNVDNSNDREIVALNLFSYLASWGMLRNSFLMQKDYLFNKGIIDILYEDKYRFLLDYDVFKNPDQNKFIELVLDLKKDIKNYYIGKHYYVDETKEKKTICRVSDTLVSKIILGTLGCIPAYDQYLCKGLRKNKISGTFNKKSLEQLICFAQENEQVVNELIKKTGDLYTPMKILDMYFWEYGFIKKTNILK